MLMKSPIKAKFLLNKKKFKLNVNLSINPTGVTGIWGASGAGKTSLLRCIAGLEKSAIGYFEINGEHWQSEEFFLPTHKRSLGYVFQESSLFSHLTAKENLDYALKRARQLIF